MSIAVIREYGELKWTGGTQSGREVSSAERVYKAGTFTVGNSSIMQMVEATTIREEIKTMNEDT